jgi:lysophospholipase L1-like esterase
VPRGIRQHCIAAICAILVALGLSEAALRTFWGFGNPALVVRDADIGYYFKPNQHVRRFGHLIAYDANGLRSEPVPASAAPGTLRILCVGDSVTNGGAPIDQHVTYPYLLQAQLQRSGAKAEVLNASAGNWSPANELAFLKKRGSFHSNVILFQIGTKSLCQAKSTGEIVGTEAFPDRKPVSALGEMLTRYLLPRLANFMAPSAAPAEAASMPAQTCPEPLRTDCLRTIEGLIQEAAARGAKPAILLTVYRDEVNDPKSVANDLRQGLFSLAQKLHVPVEDMLPRLRSAGGEDDFRDFIHPNQAGNQRMAQAAAALLKKTL